MKCLRRAFRCYGTPIALLTLGFMLVGLLGLFAGEQFGPVFLFAGVGALGVFALMGMRCSRMQQMCTDCC